MHIIDRKKWIIEKNRHLFEQLLDNSTPKFILGINEFADNVILFFKGKEIRLDGIIEDFTQETHYRNYPIKKMRDVDEKNCLIISCVINARLITALDRLKNNGFTNVLTYLELFLFFPDQISLPDHCKDNFYDITENRSEYDWLYDTLHDDESRTALEKLVDFRYNFFSDAVRGFSFDNDGQYFDDFVKFGKNEVFVDCGGYDGDTTLKFIHRNPDYKKIYFLEPSMLEYEKAKSNLANYSNIIFLNKAVSRTNSVVRFNSKSNYENKLDDEGDSMVETVKLDDVLSGPVSYIKMDVEGAEYDALLGARETILTYRPKLAISVYHDQSHFWRIPKLILSFQGEYDVYLRHYTEGISETVMYFLPKEKS